MLKYQLVLLLVLSSVEVNTNHIECNPCNQGRMCRTPKEYLKDFQDLENYTILEIPKLHCRESNLINIKWTIQDDFIYFVEIANNNTIMYTNLVRCNNITIPNLKNDTLYHFRLFSISTSKDAIKGKSNFTSFKTRLSNNYRKPVTKLYRKQLELQSNNRYNALVEWETYEDQGCYFDIVWYEADEISEYKQVEMKDPSQKHELLLENINMGSNCTMAIMTVSEDSRYESNKTWFSFVTPTCLQTFKSLDKCTPESPRNLTVEEVFIEMGDQFPIYDIILKWEKPQFEPTFYSGHLITWKNRNATKKVLNNTGNSVEMIFKSFPLGTTYQVNLWAWSAAGKSSPAFIYKHVEFNKASLGSLQSWSNLKLTLSIVIPILIILTSLILFVLLNRYYVNKSRTEQRTRYFKGLELNVPYKTEEMVLPEIDEWEIDHSKLHFKKILGEGAFGIVRNGWLEDSENEKIEVAIKMLKDLPTQQELREFYHEIEIMKTVGSHPHLVSMIGCITRGRTEGPLLVVEFCARGDLQTFLRKIWERVSNQSVKQNCRYMNDPASVTNFNNKMYEINKILIEDKFTLQSVDLLSYGRQVSLGMEYLSNLRVLHRDLAARNVLVCEDGHTIKISDFGLSRDVYQNNIYCKKGSGKLPLRWMALESMTHQRYTTQSDVWSFGILLWEIITLGGNPYPGVSNQDLLPLLKQGYRMEKPINCSTELFTIMMSCWKHSPKDRPTFSELSKMLDKLLEEHAQYINLDVNSPIQSEEFSNLSNTSISSEGYVKPIQHKK